MLISLISLVIVALIVLRVLRKAKSRREMAAHAILPEELRALQDAKQRVLIFDVRQPLDFLADAEVIPCAVRVTPQELRANPSLIPANEETIVYCTCPGEEVSREILKRALAMGYNQIKLLKGGLAAWKSKGYPVEPYHGQFHLDTAH
jgi:rhodanese-related sulfurtransferase